MRACCLRLQDGFQMPASFVNSNDVAISYDKTFLEIKRPMSDKSEKR